LSRRLSTDLGIHRSSVQRILKGDLQLRPYRIRNCQTLTARDKTARTQFAERFLDKHRHSVLWIRRIWFSDESHFYLNGRVHSQNAIFWSDEKPDFVNEVPLHSPKVTAWCAVNSTGIIGPYFYEENDQTVTVTKERYVNMLENFFLPELGEIGAKWYQQDGAPPHTSRLALQMLRDNFGDQLISLKTPFPWPPHSPDLSPLDFWL